MDWCPILKNMYAIGAIVIYIVIFYNNDVRWRNDAGFAIDSMQDE